MNMPIRTNKLNIGMVVKNYKELCSLLNQEVKTGNSKKNTSLKILNVISIGKSRGRNSLFRIYMIRH